MPNLILWWNNELITAYKHNKLNRYDLNKSS